VAQNLGVGNDRVGTKMAEVVGDLRRRAVASDRGRNRRAASGAALVE
jgi:hypothetical protein